MNIDYKGAWKELQELLSERERAYKVQGRNDKLNEIRNTIMQMKDIEEAHNIYKKIYDDFCKVILSSDNNTLFFVDNDGAVVLGMFEEIERKHLGDDAPKRPYKI